MMKLPFPETWLERSTMRHFKRRIPPHQKAEFSDLVDEILRSETDQISDPVTQNHIVFLACYLVSYRLLLRDHNDQAAAMADLRPRLMSYGRLPVKILNGLFFALPGDPIKRLKHKSIPQLKQKYGPKFEFDEEDLSNGFVSIVRKCGFMAFLQRHGESQIGPLLCEWDNLWIESLPQSIRFDRPCTIAQGCETCRFEFRSG